MKFAIAGSRGYPSYYGGFETFIRHLAPELARRGHDVTVFGHGGSRSRHHVDEYGVHSFDTRGVTTKSLSTLSHGLTAGLGARNMDLDALLLLNVANGFFIPLLKSKRIPVALNVDGIEWQRGKWGRLAQWTFRAGALASARWADRLVADSEAIAQIWSDEFGVTPSFIPYGADPPSTRLGRDRIDGLNIPSRFILVVARLVPENNVDLTLDAFEQLDTDATLVVVGSANFRFPLVDRLEEAQARGRVRWLGHINDQLLLQQLWTHCTLYIHGHEAGGTNPALLEALAYGAPTTALSTVFNAEVIGAAHAALYQRNPEDLRRRISAALQTDTSTQVTPSEGQAIINARYRWSMIVDSYEELMTDLATTH